jgi:hypothetical protein
VAAESASTTDKGHAVKFETSGFKKGNGLTGDLEVNVGDPLLLTGQDPASNFPANSSRHHVMIDTIIVPVLNNIAPWVR